MSLTLYEINILKGCLPGAPDIIIDPSDYNIYHYLVHEGYLSSTTTKDRRTREQYENYHLTKLGEDELTKINLCFPTEKICPNCLRKNIVSANSCWWCGTNT